VPISPKPGLTGESEGAASRTASLTASQGIEAAGRELRSQNGGPETGSRPGGAKGRCEMPFPDRTDVGRHSQALIRRCQKRRRGAEGAIAGHSGRKVWAVHVGVGLNCESDHLAEGTLEGPGDWRGRREADTGGTPRSTSS